jgi:hypothetical protein
MNRKTITGLAVLCVALIALGAGCAKKDTVSGDEGLDVEALAELTPEEATDVLTFKPGSSFLVTQRATLHEGRLVLEDESLNTHTVTITSFSEAAGTAASWMQVQRVPTQASLEARAAYASEEHEEGEEPPEIAFEDVRDEGTLQGIERGTSHELTLPANWAAGETRVPSSAVWLSKDAYLELSRERASAVYVKAIEAANLATKGNEELQGVVNDLREHVRDISDEVETDLMKAEGNVVEVPLTVNGKAIRVQAIQTRNWFGEMLVLNNPENPLVLKFDFNPGMEGIEAGSEAMNLIKGILSYEIPEVTL